MSSMKQQARTPDMRREHRDLVVGLRMAEIDHFVDRQRPRPERSWGRGVWPHTHTLALKFLATQGTERLRFRFDEQELASGASLMRVRDAIMACKASATGGVATTRPAQSAAPRFRAPQWREIFRRASRVALEPLARCSASPRGQPASAPIQTLQASRRGRRAHAPGPGDGALREWRCVGAATR
jgi:hypothetical protein